MLGELTKGRRIGGISSRLRRFLGGGRTTEGEGMLRQVKMAPETSRANRGIKE
jgi:hypothetical protein